MDSLWAQSPSAMGMGQFPICKLKWDLLRTSVTACTIDKNTFSAPFGMGVTVMGFAEHFGLRTVQLHSAAAIRRRTSCVRPRV